MDAETLVAICAAVISLAALLVSSGQTWLTRQHNRKSVTPVLQLRSTFRHGERAGLRLTNVGLGPARVVRSEIRLDGRVLGEYGRDTVDRVREGLQHRPSASTFSAGAFLATDYDEFLLQLVEYDRAAHTEFADLVEKRLVIRLVYASLYGDEATVTWPTGDAPAPTRPARGRT